MGILDQSLEQYVGASGGDSDPTSEYLRALQALYPNRQYRLDLPDDPSTGYYDFINQKYGTNVGNEDQFRNAFFPGSTVQNDPSAGLNYWTKQPGQEYPDYDKKDPQDAYALAAILSIAGGGALAGAGGAGGAGSSLGGGLAGVEGAGTGGIFNAAGTLGGASGGLGGLDLNALNEMFATNGAGAYEAGGGDGMGDWTDFLDNWDSSTMGDPNAYGLGGGDAGVNPGGLDAGLGDTAGNYTSGMGGNNPLTTAGGGSSNMLEEILKNPRLWSQLGASGIQALSSYFASKAQTDSANNANNTLWNMFNQNRNDLAPWRNAGATAVGQLTDLTTPGKQFDTMQLDPGYQFRLDQGQKALDNRLRAGGKFYSGTALKAGSDYNQGFASNEFNNVYNRLAGIAGTGQTATQNTAALGANTANSVAGNQTGAGNARASGYVGIGNAVQGGLQAYNQNELLNQLLPYLTR